MIADFDAFLRAVTKFGKFLLDDDDQVLLIMGTCFRLV